VEERMKKGEKNMENRKLNCNQGKEETASLKTNKKQNL
jgi:hypothetical protein